MTPVASSALMMLSSVWGSVMVMISFIRQLREQGFTVPDAAVEAVRYDCGSYQTIFAQIDYDCGETIYVTAAARTSDYDPIIALLQNVWPTGHAPENAQTADKTTKAVTEDDVNGGRSKSLA